MTMALAFLLSLRSSSSPSAACCSCSPRRSRKPDRRGGLALGATMVFARGLRLLASASGSTASRTSPERTTLRRAVARSSTASRSSSTALLCLGGALASLLAGGYLPEHELERGEFYSLLLFATDRRDDARRRRRRAHRVPRPRDDVDRRLRADRVPAHVAALRRGRAQVLPPRRVRRGAPALRLRAPLRRDRAHRSRRHRRGRRKKGGDKSPDDGHRARPRARRARSSR